MKTPAAKWLWMGGAASFIAGLALQAAFRTDDRMMPPAAATLLPPGNLAVTAPAVSPAPLRLPVPAQQPAVQSAQAEDHGPPEPAVERQIGHLADYRARLEAQLAGDPEALGEARAMLDESDPVLLAENLRVLQDSLAID